MRIKFCGLLIFFAAVHSAKIEFGKIQGVALKFSGINIVYEVLI